MISELLNVAAITISVVALAVSSYLAVRQALVARQANQIPVFVNLLSEARDPVFRDKERSIWQNIGDYSPSNGFASLPKEMRDNVEVVCSYYSIFAYCIAIGIVKHDFTVVPIRYRLLKTWEAIYPFVVAERKRRGDGQSFFNLLEDFVAEARRVDIDRVEERISRRAFPKLNKNRRSGTTGAVAAPPEKILP